MPRRRLSKILDNWDAGSGSSLSLVHLSPEARVLHDWLDEGGFSTEALEKFASLSFSASHTPPSGLFKGLDLAFCLGVGFIAYDKSGIDSMVDALGEISERFRDPKNGLVKSTAFIYMILFGSFAAVSGAESVEMMWSRTKEFVRCEWTRLKRLGFKALTKEFALLALSFGSVAGSLAGFREAGNHIRGFFYPLSSGLPGEVCVVGSAWLTNWLYVCGKPLLEKQDDLLSAYLKSVKNGLRGLKKPERVRALSDSLRIYHNAALERAIKESCDETFGENTDCSRLITKTSRLLLALFSIDDEYGDQFEHGKLFRVIVSLNTIFLDIAAGIYYGSSGLNYGFLQSNWLLATCDLLFSLPTNLILQHILAKREVVEMMFQMLQASRGEGFFNVDAWWLVTNSVLSSVGGGATGGLAASQAAKLLAALGEYLGAEWIAAGSAVSVVPLVFFLCFFAGFELCATGANGIFAKSSAFYGRRFKAVRQILAGDPEALSFFEVYKKSWFTTKFAKLAAVNAGFDKVVEGVLTTLEQLHAEHSAEEVGEIEGQLLPRVIQVLKSPEVLAALEAIAPSDAASPHPNMAHILAPLKIDLPPQAGSAGSVNSMVEDEDESDLGSSTRLLPPARKDLKIVFSRSTLFSGSREPRPGSEGSSMSQRTSYGSFSSQNGLMLEPASP